MLNISDCINNNAKQAALIPFITAGFPALDSTVPILHALAQAGADIIEVGVPFSDPMADGAAIQRANEVALANNMNLLLVLKQVEEFRQTNTTTPIVLMGYANTFINYKGDFAAAAKQAGINGLIIVDLADQDRDVWRTRLQPAGVDLIPLVAPTTSPERVKAITANAQGFLYFIALRGVTGAHHLQAADISAQIDLIKQQTTVPLAVGFGIRSKEQAAEVAQLADAVVIGSRLIEIIEADKANAATAVADFIHTINDALK